MLPDLGPHLSLPVDQDVDQSVVEDSLCSFEIRVDVSPVVVVGTLDVGVKSIEEIILLEPDAKLVTRIRRHVREEDASEAPGAAGVADQNSHYSGTPLSRMRIR